MNNRTVLVVSGLMIAIGLFWIAQGLGILTGSSFMVGDPMWAVIGGATAVAGIVLGGLALSGRLRS